MDLVTQVRTVNSLINFVTGEQMHVALTVIGDNHFRTAERVLRNLPNARDQAALLRIGISHLEGAHTAYQRQWHPSDGGLWLLKDFSRQVFRMFSYLLACKKDVYTCCLLAACYAYLKEDELAHLAIEHAELAQQDYTRLDGKELSAAKNFDEVMSSEAEIFSAYIWSITDIPASIQLRKVPEISLPDYKNNLLRILPELCSR